MAPQEYQFVTCPGPSGKRNRQVTTEVKRHVMHDYFRKRGKAGATKSSHGNNQIHKARKAKLDRSRTTVSHDSHSSSDSSCSTSDSIDENPTLFVRSPSFPERRTILSSSNFEWTEQPKQVLSIGFNAFVGCNQLDPFSSLPVNEFPDYLVQWYSCLYNHDEKTAPWIYKTNQEWAQNIWRYSIVDVGLKYTVYARAERNRMIMTGSRDKTRYLSYLGKAYVALREKISGGWHSLDLHTNSTNVCSCLGPDS